MKLYYAPGACSTATQIVLAEAGIAAESVKVDLRSKELPGGGSFLAINPKGQVPALVLDDGDVLTEGAVIMQYIADQAGASQLLPPPGSMARYHVLEWVNYVATELHKTFSPLNRPNTPAEFRELTRTMLLPRVFGVLDKRLGENQYLAGDTFTIADAYCFVVMEWTRHLTIDLSAWPNLIAYLNRIRQRPAVKSVVGSP